MAPLVVHIVLKKEQEEVVAGKEKIKQNVVCTLDILIRESSFYLTRITRMARMVYTIRAIRV